MDCVFQAIFPSMKLNEFSRNLQNKTTLSNNLLSVERRYSPSYGDARMLLFERFFVVCHSERLRVADLIQLASPIRRKKQNQGFR